MSETTYWWCPTCQVPVSGCQVTYEEYHTKCGSAVVWVDYNDPVDELRQKLSLAEKKYLDLADAVCRESKSVEDACRQARDTRHALKLSQGEVRALADMNQQIKDELLELRNTIIRTNSLLNQGFYQQAGHLIQEASEKVKVNP